LGKVTVQALTEQIAALQAEMRDITLAAGVSEEMFMKLQEVDVTTQKYHFQERLQFLQNVREAEYQQIVDVWKLLPPNVWQMYLDLGRTSLREQKLLNAARKKLRSVWRKRYEVPVDDAGQASPAGQPV
jgi:hypothetical protein